jgi:hypothetical protein
VSSSSSAEPRGSAFGLDIAADFALPGLPPPCAAPGLPQVALRLVDDAHVGRIWPAVDVTRISQEAVAGGEPDRTVDVHPAAGYRLFARDFGLCVIAQGADRLLCAPPPVPSWRWQRFLVGRCLPLASLLRGYEVIHAGAVAVNGGVAAIAGPRGAGKTSLTLHLMLRGARLYTDDVLALNTTDDGVIAYPGFGVLNVRRGEHARLSAGQRERLGAALGETAGQKVHVEAAPAREPLPLRAVFLLAPAAGRRGSTLRPLIAPDPRRLLGSAFVHETRSPPQLARLLEVCARVSELVPVVEVRRGAGEDAATLASRLDAYLRTEGPA